MFLRSSQPIPPAPTIRTRDCKHLSMIRSGVAKPPSKGERVSLGRTAEDSVKACSTCDNCDAMMLSVMLTREVFSGVKTYLSSQAKDKLKRVSRTDLTWEFSALPSERWLKVSREAAGCRLAPAGGAGWP